MYRSAGEACAALERWSVEDSEGFAFTAAGDRLTLGVARNSVVVTKQTRVADGEQIVMGWLRESAGAVLKARRAKAAKGKAVLTLAEERGELPTSIESLIAYVGFDG